MACIRSRDVSTKITTESALFCQSQISNGVFIYFLNLGQLLLDHGKVILFLRIALVSMSTVGQIDMHLLSFIKLTNLMFCLNFFFFSKFGVITQIMQNYLN